ncbi:merozoite surface protein 8, putative [Plasmodium malariae]|uniref:Merozoite surface protein 8, putative n=1 Tax=Plasmodium malariae TaxID=5858 RepID=A0A1C3KB60_PLAMA|nr:merozoite surface protein 8, putative [Plasmodium malariae]
MKKNSHVFIFIIYVIFYCKSVVEGRVDSTNNGDDVSNRINSNNKDANNGGDMSLNNDGNNNDNNNNDNNNSDNSENNVRKNVNTTGNNKDQNANSDHSKNTKNVVELGNKHNDDNEENITKKKEEALKKVIKIVDELESVQELLDGDYSVLDKYNIKLFDEEDGETNKKKVIGEYDLKMLKKILLFREKISRTCENNYKNAEEILKNCFNKDDPQLKKSYDKIKKGLTKKILGMEDFLLELLENLFNKINDNFINSDSFDLNDYISDFELINYILKNEPSEFYYDITHVIEALNLKLESSALEKVVNSVHSGMNINNKIKDDLVNILKKSSAKFFKIGIDKKAKMLIPVQAQHKGTSVKQFALQFLDKNKVCEHKKCPLNSNCYVINGEETCRCLPGYSDVKLDNEMNCVRDDTMDCNNNNGGCDINATCSFLDKKIVCECKENFEGDGIYCSNTVFNSINNFIFFILVIMYIYLF